MTIPRIININFLNALKGSIRFCLLLLVIIFLSASQLKVRSQSVVANTVHNLSLSGPGEIKAVSESEVCFFCHTPHTAKAKSPLWNKKDPGVTYTLYSSSNSSTLQALPGQPDGSSMLCLSCHDGTISLGSVLNRPVEISFSRGVHGMPNGRSKLGTDLSDDHPVSFVYNSSLTALDPQLKDPSAINSPVRLEEQKVQCTSCHDPHRNILGNFLVASTENAQLCLYCHQISNWNQSAHSTSSATWSGNGPNPWAFNPDAFKNVSGNACGNCHTSHNAGSRSRLLPYAAEEANCLNCHSGSVASKNIQAQLSKTYRHDVSLYYSMHDPAEQAIPVMRHVECNDCHNAHAANGSPAEAPYVKGSLAGVRGINSAGMPVDRSQYEYEVCFRCHSSNPATGPATQRQISQPDTRLEFSASSISYHPVTSHGKNPDVPGLIAPMTANSMIYCSDCHSGNGPDAPAGPHGSIYPQILKYQYSKAENVIESAAAYALCYFCHSRSQYNQNSGDNVNRLIHYKHVVEVKTSCNTCHDPHGISSTQGMNSRNSHLINFNTKVVSDISGMLYFQDDGYRTGRCYLRCHNKTHYPESY